MPTDSLCVYMNYSLDSSIIVDELKGRQNSTSLFRHYSLFLFKKRRNNNKN